MPDNMQRLDEIIRNIHSGAFNLECPTLALFLMSDRTAPVYSGRGVIKQNEKQFLCFSLETALADSNENDRHNSCKTKPGQLVGDTDRYTLRAVDSNGLSWTSESVFPTNRTFSIGSHVNPVAITGEILRISTEVENCKDVTNPVSEITLFEDFEFPRNTWTHSAISEQIDGETGKHADFKSRLDTALFDLGVHRVVMRKDDGITSVRIESPVGSKSKGIHDDVRECIQFALARLLSTASLSLFEGKSLCVQLLSRPDSERIPQSRPPIRNKSGRNTPAVFELMNRYFGFITSSNTVQATSVLDNVYEVLLSSTGSSGLRALGVSVAVEGILNDVFDGLAAPSRAFLDEIEKAKTLIASSDLGEEAKGRIPGALSGFERARPQDKLNALAEEKVIRKEFVKAWSGLRNNWTHGKRSKRLDRQKSYDQIESVTTLFHMLIFSAVSYSGIYTDYSQPGWPDLRYPDALKDEDSSQAAKGV